MLQKVIKHFILFLFLCFVVSIQAQDQGIVWTLLQSNETEAVIRVDFPTFQSRQVEVNGINMHHLMMQDAYPTLEKDSPELLSTTISLIIPENSNPTVEVLSSEYTQQSNFELAPSKGRITRNEDPKLVAYRKGAAYNQDQFIYDQQVMLGEPYQLRDYHGIALHFYPFAYNPVQKELKIFSNIVVKVRYNSSKAIKRLSKISTAYHSIYENHFINYTATKSTMIEETGDILILSPDMFCEALQPYVDWKIKSGYPTEIVPLSVVGNSVSEIRSFIHNYYETHNLVYVVIVGDNNYFPVATTGGNVSDNYYAEVVGNDKYPDIILGKISAQTVEQVETQVSKFIQYEKMPLQTAHFPVCLGIGSREGPGDNNEYDWQHIRNINNELSNYTYTSMYELYEGSHGGQDANGDPTPVQVSNALNSGVGIINYCGHGNITLWNTTSFNNANINNLNNVNRLPFIISVACLNGSYSNNTCFAEAWLWAKNNNNLTGAVGALMSTINQPWYAPMCAQDRMIKLLTGATNTAQKRTFGGICMNGILTMLDNYNDYEVSRTWILFGDPALHVRTAVPQTLPITYDEDVVIGNTRSTVFSTVEGAVVVLTKGQEIVSKSVISSGGAVVDIPSSMMVGDSLHLLVSAPNYIPSTGIIRIVPNDGAYVVCENFLFSDNRNHNNQVDYGETIGIHTSLKNVGVMDAQHIRTRIATNDPYLTLEKDTFNCDFIAAQQSTSSCEAYRFHVSANVPAFHQAVVDISISYNDTITLHFSRTIPVHAPNLESSSLKVDDSAQGNQNGHFDNNETVNMSFTITNRGNACSEAGTLYITNPDGLLTLYRYPQEIPALDAGESYTLTIRARSHTTTAQEAQIHIYLHSSNGYVFMQDLYVKVAYLIEDWESGNFNNFNWVNNSSKPWIITTQNPYEGIYAVRSGVLGQNQSSTLQLTHTFAFDDSLSFYIKVSSEENFDMLKFYIDNSEIDSWSGNVNWTKYSVFIPAGTHTFMWKYEKDAFVSFESDMAALDLITLPCINRTSDIDEYDAVNITISPNPTNGICQLYISDYEILREPSVQLYDITGRLLHQQHIDAHNTSMSLQAFTNGMYILKVLDEQRVIQTIKIVKE